MADKNAPLVNCESNETPTAINKTYVAIKDHLNKTELSNSAICSEAFNATKLAQDSFLGAYGFSDLPEASKNAIINGSNEECTDGKINTCEAAETIYSKELDNRIVDAVNNLRNEVRGSNEAIASASLKGPITKPPRQR